MRISRGGEHESFSDADSFADFLWDNRAEYRGITWDFIADLTHDVTATSREGCGSEILAWMVLPPQGREPATMRDYFRIFVRDALFVGCGDYMRDRTGWTVDLEGRYHGRQ